ncbi:TPA: hypothetical protein UM516_000933 [Stenotrophomonas maltophilia]|nr:hypothetical protein [Stenotrophomonas maltophilia]
MTTDNKTLADVRNLIVCDTQFGWTGSTTLKMQEMIALQDRGWVVEGEDNLEFDLTDAGREVVARALQNAVQPTLADAQPGGRVRLGDQTERARFEAWANANPGATAWDGWQAALSAHPSPGGQDAHDCLASTLGDLFMRGWIDDVSGKLIGEAARKDMAAALAARQPVGHEPTRLSSQTVDGELSVASAIDQVLELFPSSGRAALQTLAGLFTHPTIYRYAAPPAQSVDLGTGIKAIASERERQLCIEGFSRDSDEQYREGELARAATAYVQLAAMDLQVGSRKHIASQEPPFFWPWAQEWWKPVDARRDLVRAGALIAAQIDLIDSQAVGNG